MKKISFITCWLAATFLLLIAGCTDKETIQDDIPGTPAGKTITLTATMGKDAQPKTRLGYESDGEGEFPGVIVRWGAGDAFRLFYKKGTEPDIKNTIDFSIDATTIENDGKTATFKGTAPEGDATTFKAIYPASGALNDQYGTKLDKGWSSIYLWMDGQKQTGNDSYDHLAEFDYMTATVENTGDLPGDMDLQFHHECAMMTIKITGAPAGYTGTGDNAPVILTLSSNKITKEDSPNNGKYGYFYRSLGLDNNNQNGIYGPATLTLDRVIWESTGFTAHLMILPTDLSGTTFTVGVLCKDGSRYQYTSPQIGKKFVKGMRYTAILGGDNWVKVSDKEGEVPALSVYKDDTQAATGFASGTGSKDDPFIIADASQLKYLQEQVNTASPDWNKKEYYIRLDTDIKIAENWLPIGVEGGHYFKANFDGNGHTIYGNLKDVNNTYANYGFFGYIESGSISNLHLAGNVEGTRLGVNTTFNSSTYNTTGGIAGAMTAGYISGCSVKGTITGGIATEGSYSKRHCFVGGIVGRFASGYSNSRIVNCTMSGEIKASDAGHKELYMGGILGGCVKTNTMSILSCINYATVTGNNCETLYAGGLAGRIDYCSEKYNTISRIHHSINQGKVTVGGNNIGERHIGGLVGMLYQGPHPEGKTVISRIILTDCENIAAVEAGDGITGTKLYCGGLVGSTSLCTPADIVLSNSTNRGTVTGGNSVATNINYIGGLVGGNSGTLHSCLNAVSATVSTGSGAAAENQTYTGGLVGYNATGALVYSCCTNQATVNGAPATDNNRVGSASDNAPVTECPDGHTPRN